MLRAFKRPLAGSTRDIGLVAGLALIAGGLTFSAKAQPSLTESTRAELVSRATNHFARARLIKPTEPKLNEAVSTLLPWLMQEIGSNTNLPPGISSLTPDAFGLLTESNGVLSVDTSRPAIYGISESIELQGKRHARFTYLWFYHVGAAKGSPESSPSQGVRITLDTQGQPAVWEVLAHASGASLLFVSHSVETAAAAEFGRPLPGRRHAIERSLAEAPEVVIARVIEDGPVPMGPFVYLEAGTRSVTTVICRCMPVQADKLVATTMYDLLSLDRDPAATLLDAFRQQTKCPVSFWPGETASSERLQRCLRLPKNF